MRTPRRTLINGFAAAACIAAFSLTAACGTGSEQRADLNSGTATASNSYLTGNLAARNHAAHRRVLARTFAEYLPNQTFAIAGEKPVPDADAVVRGTVTSAHGSRGFYVPGGEDADAPSGTEVPFDDPRAQWRIIELTISVDDHVGAPVGRQLRAAFSVDGPDYERLLAEAQGWGQTVVVVDRPGSYDFDHDLRRIADNGTLLGTIDEAGTINFPVLKDESSRFLGTLTTWDAVEKEHAVFKDPIATDQFGARPSA